MFTLGVLSQEVNRLTKDSSSIILIPMFQSKAKVKDIRTAIIKARIPEPIVFGDWVIKSREYIVVCVTLDTGTQGWAFTLTRDGAVSEQISKTLASIYRNTLIEEREKTFDAAQKSNWASHASGIGLRALSVVDLAMWDAAARDQNISISKLLNGPRISMPVTAIVGYPPGKIGSAEIFEQVSQLYKTGWKRFKAPVFTSKTLTIERLHAMRKAAPDAWIGCDAAWTYKSVEDALGFLEGLEGINLGWFEDIFSPGDAKIVAKLRKLTSIPIAMGDEQGGLYYPEALLNEEAVDVVRIDLTCMGGITGGRKIVESCLRAKVNFAPHMFAHIHSQVFSAWGFSQVPIEWGVPWTGVDPYADSLRQPIIQGNGTMLPLDEEPGFGQLVNIEWIRSQPHEDPHGIFQN